MNSTTVLLLSGGLDSVAALHHTRPDRAVGFSYGQPHRDAELTAAGIIAARRGVPFDVILLPDLRRWPPYRPVPRPLRSSPRPRGLDPTAGRDAAGVSLAFVPGRNALFLTRAAAAYAKPGEQLHLVMGANADDYGAFPDCRGMFFAAAQAMLRAALVGVCDVWISTPWLASTKVEIVRWCASQPDALADVRDSVSCYRGTRCGQCDACALRAAAFAACGLEDGTSVQTMHGGDPGRDAKLR